MRRRDQSQRVPGASLRRDPLLNHWH